MRAAKKARFDKKILHDLVPLNALSESRFGKLADKILVEEVKSGHYLFRKGDRDSKSVYLLDGKIDLIDGFRKITGEVEAGTEMARYPIANLQPRALSARAARKSVVAYIDSNLLDVFLTCDQTQTADVVEISRADTGDWMTRVLQSEVFSKLPPAKIQSLLMKMKPFSLQAGEAVIKQGEEGDYFYTIHEGRCAVTRRQTPDGEDVLLAELADGDSFGEDSLVSNTRRNATVTMLTDGTLMRLAKQDFVELLKKQLVRYIDKITAYAMVEEGAVWLDVRTPDEYERGSFEDSVNIPLAGLRDELSELVFNATYILCCDTGGRSGSAAFMLSHKGYDVYVLEGGLAALTPDELETAGVPLQQGAYTDAAEAAPDHAEAEIIEFEAGRRNTEPGEETEADSDAEGDTSMQTPAGPASIQDGLQAELQQENALLLAEIDRYRETEQRLTEQLDLLRAELGESGEKLGELYSQARTDADEKQSLREQYATLQEELNLQRQAHESQREETARRIEELQSQLESVRLEAQAETAVASNELGDARANIERLGEALAASTERADLLEAQLAEALEAVSLHESKAEARQLEQQDIVQQLQDELGQLGAANEQLQQKLNAASEREQSTGNELQNQLREMEDRFEGLSGEFAEVSRQLEQKDAELEAGSSRVLELEQANQDLQSSLEAARHSITQLQAESGSTLQEQREAADQLRAEVAAAMEANEQLRSDLDAAVTTRDTALEELRAGLDEAAERDKQTGSELIELQRQLSESAERLAAEQARAESLKQQNDERTRSLEFLQAEVDSARGENESAATMAREQQQTLEHELNELRRELAGVTESSRETDSALESAAGAVKALEHDKETLVASLQEAESRLKEHTERIATLESEKQEAAEAISALGESHTAERLALQEQLETAQQAIAQLQAEHETSLSGLQEAQEKNEAALAASYTEQQELQQALAAELEEKTGLLARVASLDDKYAADLADKDRQIVEMQASIQAGQEEIGGLRLLIEEKNTQLDVFQKEVSEREESRKLIEEQLESSREQNNQLRLEMEQYEQHAREVEEEYRESTRKAHDDLTRKNDNEKELQGQIDRLRKQLEQATLDQHKQRESAQDNLDHIREQLHAERRARAEERADMAARQRELKEQLASIATEHEANLGNRSGALEEARDAIRAEEQERLRVVLEAQAQTEDQIQKLQQELCKAHEEISELTLQQKSARQVDVDLLQEQNQQAVSTIAQLESQLRQLSDERDSALEEQSGLRERVNALRGEVEVARGLMNMHGQGQPGNPSRLQSELDEARKNVEIAVRLRAEAEAARDRVLRERDQLRSQLNAGDEPGAQLRVPALDTQPAGMAEDTESVSDNAGYVASGRDNHAVVSSGQAAAGGFSASPRNSWLGPGIGLGISGLVALVIWLMLGTENPLSESWTSPQQPGALSAESDMNPPVNNVPVDPGAEPGQEAKTSIQETATLAVTEAPPASPDQPEVATAATVAAVRSFRDALKGGIKGPVMMELPAATYRMGSPGNSLNFDESPRHKVVLSGFSISKYEVTFAEYDRFARATGRRLPYDESWGRGNRPVVNVSWKDALAYTEWLSMQSGKSYRLPTEAEWEYAVRAGSSSRHWWEGEPAGVYANCFNCGSEWDNRQTSPVGSFPANRFGLHDMAGNVQEWTQDCYQIGYIDAPADGTAWLTPECTQRSVRGGGYTSPLDTLRSARRGQYDQDTRLDNVGFRVVRDN